MVGRRAAGGIAALLVLLAAGCSSATPSNTKSALVRVPSDVSSLQAAADRVAPGGVIELAPGTYDEGMTISTPDVTVRGTDRNRTIIDGGGIRPYGVVGIADGLRVQNLTVRNHTLYGVLITGLHDGAGPRANNGDTYQSFDPAQFPPVQRFAIEYVTAYDNGLYGIYAFDAQHGVITDSYASGSADSGFYVGQCKACDILLRGSVAERNAVGFENANASAPVTITGNRFSRNRVGMTLLSNYTEAFRPQRGNQVVGNLLSDNNESESPAQADGGFGTGLGIAGGVDNVIARNRIAGNRRAGVLLANTEDLAASGNSFEGNRLSANGVDVANISAQRAVATNTCLHPVASTLPAQLAFELTRGCQRGSTTVRLTAIDADGLPRVTVPPGTSFLKVPPPPDQPNAPALPEPIGPLPETVAGPDLDRVGVPGADLLADRSGAR